MGLHDCRLSEGAVVVGGCRCSFVDFVALAKTATAQHARRTFVRLYAP